MRTHTAGWQHTTPHAATRRVAHLSASTSAPASSIHSPLSLVAVHVKPALQRGGTSYVFQPAPRNKSMCQKHTSTSSRLTAAPISAPWSHATATPQQSSVADRAQWKAQRTW